MEGGGKERVERRSFGGEGFFLETWHLAHGRKGEEERVRGGGARGNGVYIRVVVVLKVVSLSITSNLSKL